MDARHITSFATLAASLALAVGCAGPAAVPDASVAAAYERLHSTAGGIASQDFYDGPKAAEYMLSLPIAKRNLVVQFRDPAKGADAPPDNDFMMTGYFVEADGQHWILEWYPWGGPLRPGEPGIRTVIPIGAIRDVWVAPEWVSPESR